MRKAPLVALIGWLLIGGAAPALAQTDPGPTPEQTQEAAAKYREGLQLFEEKPDDALQLFRQALALTNSPNARLMVARCLIKLGKKAEAYEELELVLQDAGEREEPKYQKTADSARAEMSALYQQVGSLSIVLPEIPPGLVVKVDGEARELSDLDMPLVLEPGKHEIVASADGLETITREVRIQGGHSKTLKLTLKPPEPKEAKKVAKPKEAPEKPEKQQPAPAPEPAATGGTLRTAGFIVAGAGVVGLGVFATTGLMAQSRYNSVDSACGGRCEDAKYADDIDSGKTLQTVANISLIVGGAAVLAGSAMIVFGGPKVTEQSNVSATALPGGGYVSYSGRF